MKKSVLLYSCQTLVMILLLTWAGSSYSKADYFNSIHVYPITSNLIALTFKSPALEYGVLTKYSPEKSDRLRTDKPGNIWLSRQNKVVGAVVGNEQKFIYRFAPRPEEIGRSNILDELGQYSLFSASDQAYVKKTSPVSIGRTTRPVDSTWTSDGLAVQVTHAIFLRLPFALKAGTKYHLNVPALIRQSSVDFTYLPDMQVSKAIHLNQLGYPPSSQAKTAYLSFWAGSLGSIDFPEGIPFSIIEETNGTIVFSSTTTLKKGRDDHDEDAYKKNYSGTDVHSIEFNSLTNPGVYHLFVEGIGCSPSFVINQRVWREPLYHTLRFFYHQRSGISLSPPYTDFLRPDQATSGFPIYRSNTRLMDTGNGFLEGLDNFTELVNGKTEVPFKRNTRSYFDAGDRDQRIQHLLVTRNLLDLYQNFPDFFLKLTLNLPESTNHLPDIIDEALWALDYYCQMQEPDGSVHGGVEATGHPFFGEPSWLERHHFYAYHPGIWATYQFAAASGQAARTMAELAPDRAHEYRTRAIKAMQKAEELFSAELNQPIQINDARNLAAIELFKLTQDSYWHDLFLKTTVFKKESDNSRLLLYQYEHHDQADAAWSYIQADQALTDPEVRKKCLDALIATADSLLVAQGKNGFGWLKDHWRPPFAGAFTIPFNRDVIRAAMLTGDEDYTAAVELSLQSVIGANPLNISYITGLGSKPVIHPHYPDARITRQKAPSGITVLGPADINFIGDSKNTLVDSYGEYCYPDLRQWPVLETFIDVFWFPLMNEFSIETMAHQVYSWALLLPITPKIILITSNVS